MRTILWIGVVICSLMIVLQSAKFLFELLMDMMVAILVYAVGEELEKGDYSPEFLSQFKTFTNRIVKLQLGDVDRDRVIEIWKDIHKRGGN